MSILHLQPSFINEPVQKALERLDAKIVYFDIWSCYTLHFSIKRKLFGITSHEYGVRDKPGRKEAFLELRYVLKEDEPPFGFCWLGTDPIASLKLFAYDRNEAIEPACDYKTVMDKPNRDELIEAWLVDCFRDDKIITEYPKV